MSKDYKSYDQKEKPYTKEQIPEIHSSKPDASDIEKLKKLYLPSSKENFRPSEAEIEDVNNLNYYKPDTLL